MARLPTRSRAKALALRLSAYATIAVALIVTLFPVYWIASNSFKFDIDIFSVPPLWFPTNPTLKHYHAAFVERPFLQYGLNSLIVAVATTCVSVVLGTMAGYALARFRYPGGSRYQISFWILSTRMMPPIVSIIPLYLFFNYFSMLNTKTALVIAYTAFNLPFATWMMMGYYRSIPEEIEDAAMIDGCNRLQAFFLVVLPLVRPALLAVALLAFTASWNEFLYAFTFLRSRELYTLPVGLSQLIVGDIQPWGLLMAASLLTAVPVATVYIVAQRLMVSGLTAGSLKG